MADPTLEAASALQALVRQLSSSRLAKMATFAKAAAPLPFPSWSSRRKRACSELTDGSITPPPSYRETDPRRSPSASPVTRPSSAYGPRLDLTAEAESGVHWDFASQGLSLLSQAFPDETDPRNPQLHRRLYVDGVAYLLRGLPDHLSDEETFRLSAVTPRQIQESTTLISQYEGSEHTALGSKTNGAAPSQPSAVRHAVRSITAQAILLMVLALPYIQAFIRQLYAVDRRYKISDRAWESSVSTANAAWKRTVVAAGGVYTVGRGPVGQSLRSTTVWWFENIHQGLYEGVADGMRCAGIHPSGRSAIELNSTPNAAGRLS